MKEYRIVTGIINFSGNLVFIDRVKEPFKDTLIMPGGKVEPGEALEDAIDREVFEETGLTVKEKIHVGFYEEYVFENGIVSIRHSINIYLITPLHGRLIDSKEGKIVQIPFGEIPMAKERINPSDYRMIERVIFNKNPGFRARIFVEKVDGKYIIKDEKDIVESNC